MRSWIPARRALAVVGAATIALALTAGAAAGQVQLWTAARHLHFHVQPTGISSLQGLHDGGATITLTNATGATVVTSTLPPNACTLDVRGTLCTYTNLAADANHPGIRFFKIRLTSVGTAKIWMDSYGDLANATSHMTIDIVMPDVPGGHWNECFVFQPTRAGWLLPDSAFQPC